MRARIVLAEDHKSVAEELRAVMDPQFDVVAEVTDGYGMIGAALVLRPDVIVADITMPQLDGVAAAEWLVRSGSTARIVFVTVHRERELVERAMKIGALGYVLKLTADEELIPAIEAALQGKRHLSAALGAVAIQ